MAWHPAHDLVEFETGHWELYDKPDSVNPRPPAKYADIRLVKRKDGSKGYRCIVLLGGTLVDVGREPTLWQAAMLVHQRKLDYGRGIPVPTGYPPPMKMDHSLPNVPDRTERD